MRHLGDITKINGAEIEAVDVITGGSPCQDLSIAGKRAGLSGARSGLFMEQVRIVKEMREHDRANGRKGAEVRPRYMVWENVCFAGETLVACKSGYKRIDQIAVGDEVKSHTGMYRPVAKVMRTKNQAVVRLKVSGAEDIICTPNHPLYIMEKVYANAGKKQGRSFTEPRWEAAGNLNDRCMVAYKLDEPTLPDNFITQDEAWALGRYMADGSVDLNRGTPRIFISVGNSKLEEAREHLHRLPYEIHENSPHATATNMVFSSQEFYNLVSGVGRGAGNKRVPPFVFDLPFKLQKCVLDGYISGDGCIRERGKCRELCCGTASRELAYGIARMIRNVFHVGVNISVRKPKDGMIGGRVIKSNYPNYGVTATLTKKVSTSVCKDGFVWQMVKSVEPCRGKATVYNLSVWEDNTYGANDVVAHNCGAFSSNRGRDFHAVLEEIARIAEPGFSLSGLPEKWKWTKAGAIDGDGWSVAWRTHDAQYWGVPQRRRRISVVADFGGDTAGEILFERKSVSRHPAESGTAGERLAETAEAGASYAVRIRSGCDGGGKGALVQEDKSGTLGTVNDQTIFCLQGNGIDRADTAGCNGKGWREDISYTLNTIDRPAVTAYSFDSLSSNSMKSKNPYSGCRSVEVAKKLDTSVPDPSKNQGGIAVMCLTPWEAQSARVYDQDGVWHSLNANENGGMARDSVMCAGFKLGNSEQARSIGYAEEQSPTLNAECGGNKPAVLCLNDQGGNVMGVSHDVSSTLRAQEHGHQPAVIAFAQNQREEVRNVGDKAVSLAAEVGMHCQTFVALDMSHACDVIRDCGEVVPSLQARMGTGGNQVPLTYQQTTGTLSPGAHAGSYNGQDAYNDMLVCGVTPDVARAILYQPKSAMEENWAASETKNALRAGESKVSHAVMCEDVSHALRANGACAYREDAETYPVQNMVVRRLTPMECERLQGFPDGWTDIGEWRDSKGKLRKPSDSPRYKALGNSIALPFWDFLAKRISAQYLRPVTMGSLFDGIGGFPLVFERHNGKGTARWASEIEEFPIAVTKLRFGGEDNGGKEVLLAEAEA